MTPFWGWADKAVWLFAPLGQLHMTKRHVIVTQESSLNKGRAFHLYMLVPTVTVIATSALLD